MAERQQQPLFLMTKLIKAGASWRQGASLDDSKPKSLLRIPLRHLAWDYLVIGQPQGGAGPCIAHQ